MPGFRSFVRIISSHVLLFCLGVAVSRGQTPAQVLAPHKPVGARVSSHMLDMEPTYPRSVVGGPWLLDSYTKSTVYMRNNNEITPLAVTPVLYLSNGKKVTLSQVVVEPGMTATVSLGDGLQAQNIAPYAPLSGYVALQYTSAYDPLCASVVSVDAVHSTVFSYGFRPTSMAPMTQARLVHQPPKEDANTVRHLEGLWWKDHQGVSGFVSISNFTDASVQGTLNTTGATGKQLNSYSITVPAHNTQVVTLPELSSPGGTSGGVDFTYTAARDSLIVSGGLEDAGTGYSAEMPMYSHRDSVPSGQVNTFAELDLMTGAADPVMLFPARTIFTPYSVIRNVSKDPATVTPELFWMQAGTMHRKLLSASQIPAGASEQLDTKAMLAQAGLSDFNGSFNLTLQTSSPAASLLLASGSIDQTGSYVFQITPHLIKESLGKVLSYWSIANGNNTMVAIWNPADEPQDLSLTLHFRGGHYTLPVHLSNRATYSLDLASLIQNQVPDASGNVIPPTATEGSAKLSGIHGENEAILVDFSAGIFNVKKATCSSPCATCQGAVSVFVEDETFSEDTPQELVFDETMENGSDYSMADSQAASWSPTSNLTVTRIGGYSYVQASQYVNGDVSVDTEPIPIYDDLCDGQAQDNEECPVDQNMDGGGNMIAVNNQPVIDGLFPMDWYPGTTQNVTYQGMYFGTNAPTLGFNPSSGITYTLQSYNDTQIVASVTVAPGTPNENVALTVTNNGYGGQAFTSGGGVSTPTSIPVNAMIYTPQPALPEITVVGWIDGTTPDLTNISTSGVNTNLINSLVEGNTSCFALIGAWATKFGLYINSQADKNYANLWLLEHSANTTPPLTLPAGFENNKGNFRLYGDWEGQPSQDGASAQIGATLNPCEKAPKDTIGGNGEPSTYNGHYQPATQSNTNIYRVFEGRAGKIGQNGYYGVTGRTLPFIWSVIKSTASGSPILNNQSIFPTFYYYTNGQLTTSVEQMPALQFLNNSDQSNETGWSPLN